MTPTSPSTEKFRTAFARPGVPSFTSNSLARIVVLCLGITMVARATAANEASFSDMRSHIEVELIDIASDAARASERLPPSVLKRLATERELIVVFNTLILQKREAIAAEDLRSLSSLIWVFGAHMSHLARAEKREIAKEREAPHTFAAHALLDRAGNVCDALINLVDLADRPATP